MRKPIYIYVTPFFPSPDCWHGSYCYNFVKALLRDGRFDVRVFLEGGSGDYHYNGILVHRFPVRRLPSNMFPFHYERKNQESFLDAVSNAKIDMDAVRVCHVNSANSVSYALAVKRANPKCFTLLHHHCLSSFGLNMGVLRHCWLYNMMLFLQMRWRHEQIDCHVFISKKVRDSFLSAPNTGWTTYADYKRQMRGLPYRSVRIKHSIVLYNGVDTDAFCPVPRPRPVTSTYIIGCVANFVPLKGHMQLLRAIDILQHKFSKCIVLKLVGTGSEREKCLRYAKDRGIQYELLPEMYPDEMPGFLSSLDLFVLPSVFEGFGCIYTEAQAVGVPFVACEGQGLDEVLSSESKRYCLAMDDDEDIAKRILSFIEKRSPMPMFNQNLDVNCLVAHFATEIEGRINS